MTALLMLGLALAAAQQPPEPPTPPDRPQMVQGQITAINARALMFTIETPPSRRGAPARTVKVQVTDTTRIGVDGKEGQFTDLKIGMRVRVRGILGEGAITAKGVMARSRPAPGLDPDTKRE